MCKIQLDVATRKVLKIWCLEMLDCCTWQRSEWFLPNNAQCSQKDEIDNNCEVWVARRLELPTFVNFVMC